MTLTASPSSATAVDRAAFGDLEAEETLLSTVDHRVVGWMLSSAALLVGVAGIALWGLVNEKLDAALRGVLPSVRYLGASTDAGFSFGRVANAVQTGLPYFVVIPLFLGIATAVVPRQLGATRMAFPRLQAFVLWGYIASVALFVAAFAVVDGPPQLTLADSLQNVSGPGNAATELILGSLMLVTIVTLLGAMNIVATVATRRRTGLRLDSIAPFAFASLVTSGVLLISSGVFLGALGLLEIDRHFGGTVTALGDRFWTHMIWFPGRPEALLLLLPGLGAITGIYADKVGARSPLGGRTANALLGAYGMLTFTVWASDSWKAQHLVQPNSTVQASLVAIPLGLLLLIGLGTVAQNRKNLKVDASLIFALGMEVLILLGVVNIIVSAVKGVPAAGVATWQYGQLSLLTVGAPIVGLLAAAVDLVPRAFGAKPAKLAGPASLAGLASFGGFAIAALALAGMAYRDNFEKSAGALSTIALIGAMIAAVGVALAALSAFGSTLDEVLVEVNTEGEV
jgi:cytochrome c oxidase subunit 1